MSAFLVRRDMLWLFLHQAATGISALLLLAAALQLSRGFVLRPIHALAVPLSVAWAWLTIYGMGSMLVAGITADGAALGCHAVATGVVFWRERGARAQPVAAHGAGRRVRPLGACIISITRCCAASGRPSSTASSPTCCSSSPSA